MHRYTPLHWTYAVLVAVSILLLGGFLLLNTTTRTSQTTSSHATAASTTARAAQNKNDTYTNIAIAGTVPSQQTDTAASPSQESTALSTVHDSTPSAPVQANVEPNTATVAASAPTRKPDNPPVDPVSVNGTTYSGYGYRVEQTRITSTISKSSAYPCGGLFRCGTERVSIASISKGYCGSFYFDQTVEQPVLFYIYSGGLAPGGEPVYSPISINADIPVGTYTGSIRLKLCSDHMTGTYVDGPLIGYIVTVTP